MMKRTNNSMSSPGIANSLFTVAAVGLAGLGLAAVASTKQAANERKIIEAELTAGTAMCQAAVLEFVTKLTEKDDKGEYIVLPSATDSSLPTMCEIQNAADADVIRFQRIRHPVCIDIARQILEIELILIALIRAGYGMSSWTADNSILSPMDMWERLDFFMYDLFHGGDMILIQQNIRDNNRLAEITRFADELKLLKLSIWDELMDIRAGGGTAAGKASVPSALRRANVTIPFLVELSNTPNPPLLHANAGLPVSVIADSTCRALIKRATEKLHHYFVEKGDESKFAEAYTEMSEALASVSNANSAEIEKVVNDLLGKFMV